MPANAVFAYAGAQLPTLRMLTEEGIWHLLTAELVAAMAALSLFPLGLAWGVRRMRRFLRERRVTWDRKGQIAATR